MKRGFLNNPRSKRTIEEAYAPRSPPQPPPRQSAGMPHQKDGGGGDEERGQASVLDVDMEAPTAQEVRTNGPVVKVRVARIADPKDDAMDVETTAVQEVYADGRVAALRVIRSTEGETPSGSCDSTKAEPHSAAKNPNGKGKAKAVVDDAMDTSDHDNPCQIPRMLRGSHRPGWGRPLDEEFFHTVPESHGGRRLKRAVFRLWPRDPDGKPLMPTDKPSGTLSPDGYPWGATLYDIYHVNRIPQVTGMMSVMTGSAICQGMVAMGELDVAAPEIEWAKSEGQPRIEGAADTEECIKSFDTLVQRLFPFRDMCGVKNGENEGKEKEKEDEDVDKQPVQVPPPPTIPVTSPFHPSHYPKPWPFTPFEHEHSILLQEQIPLHLLPQTLCVHDPFCLLAARETRFPDTSWTSRPDVVRTYELHLSGPVRQQCERARKKAEELETLKSRTLIIMRYKRTKEQIKNHEPIIEVPLPPYPCRPTKVEESHLYLSPVAKVGKGHHSFVYKGEWELPRDVFVKQRICPLCFKECADKELQRLKDTGRWDKMLKAASWGPNGFTGREPTRAELDAINDPTNLARDGEIIEREITCVVPPNADPSQIVEMIDKTDTWDEFMQKKELNAAQLWLIKDDEDEFTKGSYVAVMRIDPPFSYESQKSCTHDMRRGPVPRTANFTVVAKLSFEDDPHLAREARNYQKFPERFFQFYNGYTIISQLKTIVPVNAVVPQFYGYYTPQEKDEAKYPDEPDYLSPVLLLEHCGKPIDPAELSVEEQEECASLFLRFQRAGWLHESVAPRNFLVQLGKPTEFPLMRQSKPEPSFRLIDFGRSRRYERADEKRSEEMETLRMFGKLMGQMGVTLW